MPVDKFLPRVPEPSQADLQTLYDKYKDVLPDPGRETPGFKVPRQVQVEILSIDGNALQRGIRDKLTETDSALITKITSRSSRFPTSCPRICSPTSLISRLRSSSRSRK